MSNSNENTKDVDSEKITIGKVTHTRKDWGEIQELIEDMRKDVKAITKRMWSSGMDSTYYMSQSNRPKQWELHSGCRPCAFVCDCCDRMQHRCVGGANMWVYRKEWSCDFEKMLCDRCYYNKDKRCSCKLAPGYAPIETDNKAGSRRVRNKCCKCYEYAYPCKGCSLYITDEERDGDETMTYYEFLDRISRRKRKEYPSEYIDFLTQRYPYPIHESL